MTRKLPNNLTLPVDFVAREDHGHSDEDLGRSLFMDVYRRSYLGQPAPQFFVYQSAVVERIHLKSTESYTFAQKQLLLAGICGREGVENVALCASFKDSNGKKGAYSFIEWPDNRWWLGFQFLTKQGPLLSGHPIVKCAINGHPKPGKLGSWFAMARRMSLKLQLNLKTTKTVH